MRNRSVPLTRRFYSLYSCGLNCKGPALRSGILLSTSIASPRQRHSAVVVGMIALAGFIATIPFASVGRSRTLLALAFGYLFTALPTLDLWLAVVMFTWVCTIYLVSFQSAERYDAAWYVGRVFEVLTSLFVLVVLLSETIVFYARSIRAVEDRAARTRAAG